MNLDCGCEQETMNWDELDSTEIDGVLTQQDIESCFTLLGVSCVEDLL